MKDLHLLPKIRDSLSYLYVEHCKIDQEQKAIALHDAKGMAPIPCASLSLLMLGPGTTVTHAAIRALADNGCMVAWCGEEGVRMYAQGMGETRSARRLLRQALLFADPMEHLKVVLRMYQMRFAEVLGPNLSIEQIRGKEGLRVRAAYARASAETGVPWTGRVFPSATVKGQTMDAVNRALSVANSCLYGLCHAAIVSAGYSPALGFVHTGKMLAFVYDIADLYKTEVSIPVAFAVAKEGDEKVDTRARHACRDMFRDTRFLQRIMPDIDRVLFGEVQPAPGEAGYDTEELNVGGWWDPTAGEVQGGMNAADTPSPAPTIPVAASDNEEAF